MAEKGPMSGFRHNIQGFVPTYFFYKRKRIKIEKGTNYHQMKIVYSNFQRYFRRYYKPAKGSKRL
jgi:hypothetical protein